MQSGPGCFIISPIGDAGSARRAAADAVRDAIIYPACDIAERAGIKGRPITIAPRWRGERDEKNVAITRRIVDAILATDLLVVVASEPNPNVFYEAGIAHSAGRPLLILRHESLPTPFDIAHLPHIKYTDADLIRPIDKDHPATALAGMMTAQLSDPRRKYNDPFERPELGPLSTERILQRFNALSYRDWSKMLLEAQHEIMLAGISLHELINPLKARRFFIPDQDEHRNDPDGLPAAANATIGEVLTYAMTTGRSVVDTTVIMMAPDNPALPSLLLQPGDSLISTDDVVRKLHDEIAEATKWWQIEQQRIASTPPEDGRRNGRLRIVQLYEGCVPQRITWTDQEMVVTPFFNTFGLSSGPAVRTRAGHLWHDLTRKELNLLIALNQDRPLAVPEPSRIPA